MSQYSFECQAEADYWLQGPEENAPEIDEINYTGHTVYEQLQEMLNKCIELGWKPRGKEMLGINYSIIRTIRVEGKKIIIGGLDRMEMHDFYSYHDLFSVESGIMEFVEWNSIGNQAVDYHDDIDYSENEYAHIRYDRYYDCDTLYHYAKISNMTAEEKCNYFVNNAIIPTK